MTKIKYPKFKNLSRLPSGSYQLKLKENGIEIQTVAHSLAEAIELRNSHYLDRGYRPAHLHILNFDMSCVRHDIGIEKSGNAYHRYQVHSRRLHDRKYKPRGFASRTEADAFASRWIPAHNGIAAVYNGWREEIFLKQLAAEQALLVPLIETQFDLELWSKAAKVVFGKNIPTFHK
ncbi:hypothetical protein AB4254_12200 [Vibrio breoganii]